MSVAKIEKRGVLVIPAEIRRISGVKEGDDVLVEVGETGIIHIMKRPQDFVAALRDLHSEIWSGIEPMEYIRKERGSWEK